MTAIIWELWADVLWHGFSVGRGGEKHQGPGNRVDHPRQVEITIAFVVEVKIRLRHNGQASTASWEKASWVLD